VCSPESRSRLYIIVGNLQDAREVRRRYIDALEAADNHDIGALLAFARSSFGALSRLLEPPAATSWALRRSRRSTSAPAAERRTTYRLVDRPRQTFYG
jgi:hypothetical protein